MNGPFESVLLKQETATLSSATLSSSREHGTHFAQETLLKSSCLIAARTHLPLIMHISPDKEDINSLERVLEILNEENYGVRVILHDALTATACDVSRMRAVVEAGWMCAISGAALTDANPEIRAQAVEVLTCVPVEQILVCSDAPWHTPQNHPDAYVRGMRNEPSNLSYVVQAVFEVKGEEMTRCEFDCALKERSLHALGLEGGGDGS